MQAQEIGLRMRGVTGLGGGAGQPDNTADGDDGRRALSPVTGVGVE